jgi:hypothetical protein
MEQSGLVHTLILRYFNFHFNIILLFKLRIIKGSLIIKNLDQYFTPIFQIIDSCSFYCPPSNMETRTNYASPHYVTSVLFSRPLVIYRRSLHINLDPSEDGRPDFTET